MTAFTTRPLTPDTWPAFAALAERHNGVWNGCWCTAFHPARAEKGGGAEATRAYKHELVQTGRAHAALVLHGERAVAWCQYGTPQELPRIYHRRQYQAEQDLVPDYRITCFFIDRDYRRQGVAAIALAGALEMISRAGGGTVEAYPQDTQGNRVSASFLYNGTRSLFEQAGFGYQRAKGRNHCVMRAEVPGQDSSGVPPPSASTTR